MLILSRHAKQSVIIGDGLITIKVLDIRGGKVRLGIEAPPDIPVHRKEIHDLIEKSQNSIVRASSF